MKLLILDNDLLYIKRFEKFFTKKFSDFQISVFDNISNAEEAIKNNSFDIILFGESFDNIEMENYKEIISQTAFAYFSAKNEIINERETIFKYSSISEIHKSLCAVYEKDKNRIVRSSLDNENVSTKKSQIITFIPVHGGAGSSTMAAACAISLAENAKTLYVSYEQRSASKLIFDNKSHKGMSDIVCVMKSKYTDSGIKQIIKDVIQPDTKQTHYAQLSCINGYKNILDCMSMTPQITENFFNILKNKFNFEYIIIDTDYIVSDLMKQIIFQSDKLVFTSQGSDTADVKQKELNRYLDIIKRENKNNMPQKYLIFNKYYGNENDEHNETGDMKIIARLARYRSDDKLSCQAIIDEILRKDIFSELK